MFGAVEQTKIMINWTLDNYNDSGSGLVVFVGVTKPNRNSLVPTVSYGRLYGRLVCTLLLPVSPWELHSNPFIFPPGQEENIEKIEIK